MALRDDSLKQIAVDVSYAMDVMGLGVERCEYLVQVEGWMGVVEVKWRA